MKFIVFLIKLPFIIIKFLLKPLWWILCILGLAIGMDLGALKTNAWVCPYCQNKLKSNRVSKCHHCLSDLRNQVINRGYIK